MRLSKRASADFRCRRRSRPQPVGSSWSHSTAEKFQASAWSGVERQAQYFRPIPTSYAAEPLKSEISISNDLPPVWPWHDGDTRGVGLEPLYKNVSRAALRDPALYQLLALVDAIRDGRARERNLAERDLVHRLKSIHGQP